MGGKRNLHRIRQEAAVARRKLILLRDYLTEVDDRNGYNKDFLIRKIHSAIDQVNKTERHAWTKVYRTKRQRSDLYPEFTTEEVADVSQIVRDVLREARSLVGNTEVIFNEPEYVKVVDVAGNAILMARIRALEAEKKQLEADKANLILEKLRLEAEKAALEAKKTQLEAEEKKLTSQIASMGKINKIAANALKAKHKKKLDDLKDDHTAAVAALNANHLLALQAEKDKTEAERKLRETAEKERKLAKDSLAAVRTAKVKAEADLRDLQDQVAGLDAAAKAAAKDLYDKQLLVEKTKWEKEKAKLRADLKEAQDKETTANSQLAVVQAELEAKEKDLKAANARVVALKGVESQLKALQATVAGIISARDEFQRKLEEEKKKAEQLTNDLADAKRNLEAKNKELEVVGKEHAASTLKWALKIETAKLEAKNARETLEKVTSAKKSAADPKISTSLNDKIEKLTGDLKTAETNLTQVQFLNSQMEKEHKRKINELTAAKDASVARAEELDKKVTELKAENLILTDNMKKMMEEHKEKLSQQASTMIPKVTHDEMKNKKDDELRNYKLAYKSVGKLKDAVVEFLKNIDKTYKSDEKAKLLNNWDTVDQYYQTLVDTFNNAVKKPQMYKQQYDQIRLHIDKLETDVQNLTGKINYVLEPRIKELNGIKENLEEKLEETSRTGEYLERLVELSYALGKRTVSYIIISKMYDAIKKQWYNTADIMKNLYNGMEYRINNSQDLDIKDLHDWMKMIYEGLKRFDSFRNSIQEIYKKSHKGGRYAYNEIEKVGDKSENVVYNTHFDGTHNLGGIVPTKEDALKIMYKYLSDLGINDDIINDLKTAIKENDGTFTEKLNEGIEAAMSSMTKHLDIGDDEDDEKEENSNEITEEEKQQLLQHLKDLSELYKYMYELNDAGNLVPMTSESMNTTLKAESLQEESLGEKWYLQLPDKGGILIKTISGKNETTMPQHDKMDLGVKIINEFIKQQTEKHEEYLKSLSRVELVEYYRNTGNIYVSSEIPRGGFTDDDDMKRFNSAIMKGVDNSKEAREVGVTRFQFKKGYDELKNAIPVFDYAEFTKFNTVPELLQNLSGFGDLYKKGAAAYAINRAINQIKADNEKNAIQFYKQLMESISSRLVSSNPILASKGGKKLNSLEEIKNYLVAEGDPDKKYEIVAKGDEKFINVTNENGKKISKAEIMAALLYPWMKEHKNVPDAIKQMGLPRNSVRRHQSVRGGNEVTGGDITLLSSAGLVLSNGLIGIIIFCLLIVIYYLGSKIYDSYNKSKYDDDCHKLIHPAHR